MAGEKARRIVKAVSESLMAHERVIDELPPGAMIRLDVKTDQSGLVKSVHFRSESTVDLGDITRRPPPR